MIFSSIIIVHIAKSKKYSNSHHFIKTDFIFYMGLYNHVDLNFTFFRNIFTQKWFRFLFGIVFLHLLYTNLYELYLIECILGNVIIWLWHYHLISSHLSHSNSLFYMFDEYYNHLYMFRLVGQNKSMFMRH